MIITVRRGISIYSKCLADSEQSKKLGEIKSMSSNAEFTVNKGDLVAQLSENGHFESKAAAERAVNAIFGGIISGLKSDGEAKFVGFGSFVVTKRKARKGRNPRTGEDIKIKASKGVRFRAAQLVKDSVKKTKVK